LNFRTLDLNLLRVFDSVMSEGSLTRSAQALALTQPAMSHAVKRLREAVGEELFTRTASGMQPTARARSLWPQVRAALAGLQQALAPEGFDPDTDATTFRLAMADATAVLLSPGLVPAFEAHGAMLSMRVLPLTTRDPRPWLDAGEVDLAVGYFPEVQAALVAQGHDSAYRLQHLYATRYVCVMRRGHPLAAAPQLELDAYCGALHLLVSFSGKPHGYVDEALASLQRQRRVVMTVNQFATAGQVVMRSDLLTVLPEGFVQATGCAADLVTRELPLALPPVQVAMLWHRRMALQPAQTWLRQQVVAAVPLSATAGPAPKRARPARLAPPAKTPRRARPG
jgi:DNA-binding transcriptional LysR family regulator